MSHRELSVSTSAHISPALFPDSISANVQKCLCLVQADFQAPQLQYLHDLYHWASVIFYILWLWPGPSPRQIEMLLLVQPHSVLFIIPWNTSLVAQMVKSLPAMQETLLQSLGREDSLEKEMATYSRILAWEIPWTEEPGGLQSMGSQRIGHDWMTNTFTFKEHLQRGTDFSCEFVSLRD